MLLVSAGARKRGVSSLRILVSVGLYYYGEVLITVDE